MMGRGVRNKSEERLKIGPRENKSEKGKDGGRRGGERVGMRERKWHIGKHGEVGLQAQ